MSNVTFSSFAASVGGCSSMDDLIKVRPFGLAINSTGELDINEKIFFGIFCPCLCVVGMISNALTLVTARNRRLTSQSYTFIATLAAAQLITLTAEYVHFVVTTFFRNNLQGNIVKIYVTLPIIDWMGSYSLLLTLALVMDRLICIRMDKPRSGGIVEKQKRAKTLCATIFASITLVALPTMTMYTLDDTYQCPIERWDRSLLSTFTIYVHVRYLIVNGGSIFLSTLFNLLLIYSCFHEIWPYGRKTFYQRQVKAMRPRSFSSIRVKKLERQRRSLTVSVVIIVAVAIVAEALRMLLDDVTIYALRRVFFIQAEAYFPYSRTTLSQICLLIECSVAFWCLVAINKRFRKTFLSICCKSKRHLNLGRNVSVEEEYPL